MVQYDNINKDIVRLLVLLVVLMLITVTTRLYWKLNSFSLRNRLS